MTHASSPSPVPPMPRRRRPEPLFIDENHDAVRFYLHESVDVDDRIELTGLIEVVESYHGCIHSNYSRNMAVS